MRGVGERGSKGMRRVERGGEKGGEKVCEGV